MSGELVRNMILLLMYNKSHGFLEKASQTLYRYRQKLMSLQSSLVRLGVALAAQDAGLVCVFFFRNTFDTL
jgi:hypothetical protein